MKIKHLWLSLMLCLLITGCVGNTPSSPKGQWLEEDAIQKIIENGTVFPGHTYYYLGSITAPDSFIAIDNRWQLRTRVWAEVAMSPKRLAGWLQWYRTEDYYGGCEYRAGRILAPDGSPVGYWYSQNPINNIYMPEPGVIEVYKPHNIGGQVCGEPRDDGFSFGSD
ncbi:MAG: hypothetical protein AB7U29_17725 [Desulfobulbus sp.]